MLPVYTNDQIANYLTSGFATNQGYTQSHWNVSTGGTMTINISALTAAGQFFATEAVKTWSEITGINFTYTTGVAQISFFNDGTSSAYETDSSIGGFTTSASIHISQDWIAGDIGKLNSYSYQTYLHEFGHALGLGHAGNYNGSATYDPNLGTAGHNQYVNDSWQTSVMSYFSQTENTYLNPVGGTSTAGFAFVMTPMAADILAVQSLYGVSTTAHTGNTVYGFHATAGNVIFDATQITGASYTIEDSNGIDTMDYSGYTMAQKISLVAETFSDIGGVKGSVTIARGTVVENAIGGSGSDVIIGNVADNNLTGGAGADTITGGGGNDTVSYLGSSVGVTVNLNLTTAQISVGDASGDILSGILNLTGSALNDKLTGNAGNNLLIGGAGADTLIGGGGSDTVSFADSAFAVTVDLRLITAQVSGGDAYGDILSGIVNLFGSSRADTLIGDGNSNVLNGGSGYDTLVGGAGDDRLVIDATHVSGVDTLSGEAGRDTIDLSGMASAVWVDLQYTSMEVWASGLNFAYGGNANTQVANLDTIENIVGTSGSDTVLGDGLDNSYKYTGNTAGIVDVFYGRGGFDTIDLSLMNSAWVDLNRASYNNNVFTSGLNFSYGYNSNSAVLALQTVENIIGTTGSDVIYGDGADNTFVSNGVAHVGNAAPIAVDYFNGGAGSDTIDLSSLNYSGALWVDLTYAGYQVWLAQGQSAAYGYNANTPIATLVSVENIVGTSGSDQFLGDASNNTYFYNGHGAGSTDYFDGRGGNNTFDGSRSDTSLWVGLGYSAMEVWSVGSTANSTSANANTMVANLVSVENVTGSQYGDTLVGDGANNRIEGGKGDDVLAGGGGADTFVFKFDAINQQGSGHDQINDFAPGAGANHGVLEIDGYGTSLASFAQLLTLSIDTATGVHIQLTANDSIDLLGLIKAQLTTDDFIFG